MPDGCHPEVVTGTSAVRTTYTERLLPRGAIWLVPPGAGLMAGLVVTPLGGGMAVVAGAAVAAIVAVILVTSSPQVRVSGGELTAGKAVIPVDLLGATVHHDRSGTRRAMGVDLDLRAWVCNRPWIGPSLQVSVHDPADPTPYWLISTRRPDLLDAAIQRAKQRTSSSANG